MKFLDIVTTWLESTHDNSVYFNHIFQNSRIKAQYSTGEQNDAFLGDSGYRSMLYANLKSANSC